MNRGQRAKYVCFDCGEATAATALVYRLVTYAGGGDPERIPVLVHRAGAGCHKGDTPAEVREPR